MLKQRQLELLLDELCVKNGFCLPSDEYDRLLANPPQDVLAFTDAVFRAEGLNPEHASRSAYRAVRDRIAEAFRQADLEDDYADALRRAGEKHDA
jgi:hypothetical protein